MDISYGWLRALVPGLDMGVEEVSDHLADRGAPVEEIERVGEGLEGVRVGRVRAVELHPNADRLALCSVDAGAGDPLQVVCGAPNVEVGGLYPFAPVGSTLPGGTEIGEAEIRGVTSHGMLCSARELGLGTDHAGLMELPAGIEPGVPILDVLELSDWRLDVEITANRGDLLSHVGVAREVAPDGVGSIRLTDIPDGSEASLDLMQGTREVSAGGATVRIDDPDLCHRYIGAVIRGVEVGPSPAWLQARLRAAGSRPINNVVDATNYVLLELGQPLHAFDLDRLAEGTIVVRRARKDEESFTTLDGEERKLGGDMLMICDAARPVAIAGVMGGLDSEVTDDTVDVLLECALFDPASIRNTRRELNLSTDASYRFERGVDPAGMEQAVKRAVEIILATAGGALELQAADCVPVAWRPERVELRLGRIETVLGIPFEEARVRELLTPLGFEIAPTEGECADDEVLSVRVPGWRSYDVTREIDLIEEIARTHGYDNFPAELGAYRPGTVPDHPLFQLEDGLRTLLAARGWYEAQTPAFVPAHQGEVRVRNPVSREEDHLRKEILPSLLRRVEHNWARGVRDIRLFELATSFSATGEGGLPDEETRLAVVATGRRAPVHWSGEGEAIDVWDLKDLLETLVERARSGCTLVPGAPEGTPWVSSEGFSVIDPTGTTVGWAGRVRAETVDAPAWADPVWGVELALPEHPDVDDEITYDPLPPYPAVERDLALLVPDETPAATVKRAIEQAGGDLLADVVLFDRYEGEGVGRGLRSLAYRLRFQSLERTLTDEDVDRATEDVLEHLREELGVHARG